MAELQNDRLLRALLRQPVDVTPVWMMRQAGRYLPEYRATRQQAGSFLKLCHTPELACEVSLQPLRRYPLDAAILFSDILTLPDAMGLGLYFSEGEGPGFERPIRHEKDVEALRVPDPEQELKYVMDTVRLLRHELCGRVPLIGFAGSPWTLATYMVEGGSSRTFPVIKEMLYNRPDLMHQLLRKIAQAAIQYLNAQVAAGAQALMIFDTWGGVLPAKEYYTFSLGYMSQVVKYLVRNKEGRRVPVILFTKGGAAWLEAIADSGCECIGLDWTLDMGEARRRVGRMVSLQGNMDPVLLRSAPDRIRSAVAAILESYGQGSGHIFNLGHGVQPDVNPEHVGVMIESVHELSAQYHCEG